MAQPLKYTLAQINPIVGDIHGNAEKIITCWNQAEQNDLLLMPELTLSGYPPEDLVFRSPFMDAIEDAVDEIVSLSKNRDCALLLTTPWRVDSGHDKAHGDIIHDEKIYNVAHLIHRGEILAIIAKHHLANYGVFDEKRNFVSGPIPDPVDFKGHKLGIMICEDFWRKDVPIHLKDAGAEIFIVPNGSPFAIGKDDLRKAHAASVTERLGVAAIYMNQVGGQDELSFDGGSLVMNENGELVIQLPFFEEAVQHYMLGDTNLINVPSDEELIYEALILGLKDYVEKNNFPGVLLGLSGGVDSALVATIAVDALGAEKVKAFMLPSRYTSQESLDDAAALAKNFDIALEEISIEEPLKGFESATSITSGVAHENLQSRIRGTILMAQSNESGLMLLTTGNKSEMATGYATLYGDMNGGFNPIKDVYKTQVYKLCEWRNQKEAVIPERILTKAPTAELRDNQTDQDSLPPYDVLDDILSGLIEDAVGTEELVARDHDKETILKVWKMLDQNEYKRYQAAPGTKVTSMAFGRDRRYPMTNRSIKTIEKANK